MSLPLVSKLEMNKGANTQDTWIGHSPLKEKFPTLFNLAVDINLSVTQSKEGNFLMIFRRNLNDWKMGRILISLVFFPQL